jgi:hypothetical protein
LEIANQTPGSENLILVGSLPQVFAEENAQIDYKIGKDVHHTVPGKGIFQEIIK